MLYEGLGSAVVETAAGNAVRLRAGDTTIELTALAADLFRVGVFPRAKPPRYDSGAIAKEDWPGGRAQ
jgi:alpha-glucosidase